MSRKDTPRRHPKHRNGVATFNKLLAATGQLLDEQPFGPFTSTDICAKAGVSVGSFYAYFRDKPDVIDKLREQLGQRFITLLRAEVESKDPYIYNLGNALVLLVPAMVDAVQLQPGATKITFPISQVATDVAELMATYAGDMDWAELHRRLGFALPVVWACVRQVAEYPDGSEFILTKLVSVVEGLAGEHV